MSPSLAHRSPSSLMTPLLCLAIFILTTSLTPVQAHSTTRRPLAALLNLTNPRIHTPAHRITAYSSFDLSFSFAPARTRTDDISDDAIESYYAEGSSASGEVLLRLEPNHDILPEGACISFLNADGSFQRREGFERAVHKVFKGSVFTSDGRAHSTTFDGSDDRNDTQDFKDGRAIQFPSQQVPVASTKWRHAGWARVLVRRDGEDPFFEGAFTVDAVSYHVVSSRNYQGTKLASDPELDEVPSDENGKEEETMVMWRDSDLVPSWHQDLRRRDNITTDSVCASDDLHFNLRTNGLASRGSEMLDYSRMFKRQQTSALNLRSTIGQTAGCPSTHKVALVGVATDCSYAQQFNSTQTLRENIIAQMNQASAVWENAFNISLGLRNLTVSAADCPATPREPTRWNRGCSDSYTIGERLSDFSAWRGSLGSGDTNSHWTLLTTCNTGSTIGLAWMRQACVNSAFTSTSGGFTGNGDTVQNQTVSGANVVVRTSGTNEWQVIAHETAHTYGAVHDCDSSACSADSSSSSSSSSLSTQCCPLTSQTCSANGQYLMNPATSQEASHFSPCTIGNICSALGNNLINSTCLSDNSGVVTLGGGQCGNGIVEPGEECDCGDAASCADDLCCNGDTCRFAEGAVCDDVNDQCCDSCQFAKQGTVCRASTGECDPAEQCSGQAATCPNDSRAPDGQTCGSEGEGRACASGFCTSRDLQCQSAMAAYVNSSSSSATSGYGGGNGSLLEFASACDDLTCTVTCASPSFGYGGNVCYSLQQNFLDGTTCGAGGGQCVNGQCTGVTVNDQVRSWVDEHKGLVIGLSVAAGVLFLLGILGCIGRMWSRRKRSMELRRAANSGAVAVDAPRRRHRRQLSSPATPGGWQGWDAAGARNMVQAPPREQYGWYAGDGAVRGGHDMRPPPPPPPPPVYLGTEQQSMRYA